MPGSQLSKVERVIALAGNLFPAALYSRSRCVSVGFDFLAIVCRSTARGTDDGIDCSASDVDGCCCSSSMDAADANITSGNFRTALCEQDGCCW